MAKKTKKSFPYSETAVELTAVPEDTRPAQAVPASKPAPAPKPQVPVTKKRIRVRKKATKHLSVAVLCANPQTRRFI